MTVASAFLTRWSSSAFKILRASSARLRAGNVDVHADQTICVAGLIILYETARLDPADRSAGTHKAKFCAMLAAPLGK